MKTKITLYAVLLLSSLTISAQTTFDWETAIATPNAISETIDGITVTFVSDTGNVAHFDAAGFAGSTGFIASCNPSMTDTFTTISFSEPVTLNSVYSFHGYTGDENTIWTYTSNNGDVKHRAISETTGTTANLSFENITSITITSDTGTDWFAFDSIIINDAVIICPPGDVSLNSQTAVNNFGVMYPDCEDIKGALNLLNSNSNSIVDLSPLNNKIKTVSSYCRINGTGLTTLEGLNGLEYIGDFLELKNNTVLTDATALESVVYVSDYLNSDGNTLLDNVDFIIPFIATHEVYIKNHPNLIALGDLSTVQSISDLVIQDNGLIELFGFENVTAIESLHIEESNITSLLPLSAVNSISNLFIKNNDNITSLLGLENVTTLGGLELEGLTALNTLSSFPNVTSFNGLTIVNSPSLLNLDGLENIVSLGKFRFEFNGLTNLDGLNNLESLFAFADNFLIEENLDSVGLTSLINLPLSNYFSIYLPNTSDMCGMANFFEYGNINPTAFFNLYADGGNLTTTQEVIDVCDTLSTPSYLLDTLIVFPNPTLGIISIKDPHNLIHYSEFYDIQGRLIQHINQDFNQIDISQQASGLYLLKLYNSNNHVIATQKIIKN